MQSIPLIQVGNSSEELTLESVTGTFFRGTTRNQGFSCDVAPSFAKVRRVFWAVPTESEGFQGEARSVFPIGTQGTQSPLSFAAHKRRARGPGTNWVGGAVLHLSKGDLLDHFFRRKNRKQGFLGYSAPSFANVRRVVRAAKSVEGVCHSSSDKSPSPFW